LLPGAFMHAWRSCLTLLLPSQPAYIGWLAEASLASQPSLADLHPHPRARRLSGVKFDPATRRRCAQASARSSRS
jgi:hypothetical protein